MDAMRKWLVRANAVPVFAASLLVLGLQAAWLIWRETRPVRMDTPATSARPRSSPDEPLELLAFLDNAVEARAASGSPFFNPRPDRPPIVRSFRPNPSEPEPPAHRPPAPPPPPPKRETVRLTYRGLFENSAAESRALIEDSKRRRRSFYRIGEMIFGMRVQEIRMLEVSLRPTDGEDVILRLGEPYEVEERPHGY